MLKVTLWKENLEGAWVILSEVARGRQANMTSSGSGAGIGYGATSTTTAAPRGPAASTRDSASGGATYNCGSADSPSIHPHSGTDTAHPPVAFYDHSAAPAVTNPASVPP
ncbi:unnamed protein product [Hydatigera taeniaeformis]|uniref:Uncharacterized protein n=1 Tax=Hydatigena taeniaeformis TaxID=6205 RepID=A0A0R3WJH7_HYDTA|nr:unnamed protein product [Hydatigera taeniaeformis]